MFGPNQDIAYDIQLKGAFKSNGGQENRVESTKDYSNGILNQGFNEKIRKYSELAKVSNVSFVPLIFLDTGKAHRAAAKFMKWLCYVAIPGSRCQQNKSMHCYWQRLDWKIFLSNSETECIDDTTLYHKR